MGIGGYDIIFPINLLSPEEIKLGLLKICKKHWQEMNSYKQKILFHYLPLMSIAEQAWNDCDAEPNTMFYFIANDNEVTLVVDDKDDISIKEMLEEIGQYLK